MASRKAVERYGDLGRFVTESLNAVNQTTQKIKIRDVFGNSLEAENIDGVVTTAAAEGMLAAACSTAAPPREWPIKIFGASY